MQVREDHSWTDRGMKHARDCGICLDSDRARSERLFVRPVTFPGVDMADVEHITVSVLGIQWLCVYSEVKESIVSKRRKPV